MRTPLLDRNSVQSVATSTPFSSCSCPWSSPTPSQGSSSTSLLLPSFFLFSPRPLLSLFFLHIYSLLLSPPSLAFSLPSPTEANSPFGHSVVLLFLVTIWSIQLLESSGGSRSPSHCLTSGCFIMPSLNSATFVTKQEATKASLHVLPAPCWLLCF